MYVKVCSAVLGCVVALAAMAEELPRGQVIEHVACAGRRHCDYALYLPSSYTAERRWPVIVAFDPAARGAAPVRLLEPVAERLGVIVAGSNDSKNGPWEPILAAQKAMWKDLHERFAIEPKRAVATGFSGGARAALRMALDRDDEFLGVIPCGAFFTQVDEFPRRTHLAFYGLVGRDDLALSEFKGAARLLGERQVRLWIEVFEGGHAWPPQERMAEAVEFLRIEAGRKGLAPRDEGLERTWVSARLERARGLEAPGSRIWAAWTYRQLASVFPGVEGSAAATAEARRLAADPEVTEATAKERSFEEALAALNDLNDTKRFQSAWQEVTALAAGGGPLAGRAAHTVRNVPDNLARFALQALDAGEPRQSEQALTVADGLRPADRLASYNIACGWARLGRKAEAMAALERAVAAGFAGRELMLTDDDLRSLRNEPAFRALLERLPARNGLRRGGQADLDRDARPRPRHAAEAPRVIAEDEAVRILAQHRDRRVEPRAQRRGRRRGRRLVRVRRHDHGAATLLVLDLRRRRGDPAAEPQRVAVTQRDDRAERERAADQALRSGDAALRQHLGERVGKRRGGNPRGDFARHLDQRRRHRFPPGLVARDHEEVAAHHHQLMAPGGVARVEPRRRCLLAALPEVDAERGQRVAHPIQLERDLVVAAPEALHGDPLEPELEEDLGAAVDVAVQFGAGEHLRRLGAAEPSGGAFGRHQRQVVGARRRRQQQRRGEQQRHAFTVNSLSLAGSATPRPSCSA